MRSENSCGILSAALTKGFNPVAILRSLAFTLGAFVLVSCGDVTGPITIGQSLAPRAQMIDGRNGGASGFYFLPPIGRTAVYSGVFDPARSPAVEVCEVIASTCGAPLARFTQVTGNGSERIRVSVEEQHYVVQLHIRTLNPSVGRTYRIRVLEGLLELGRADLVVVKKESDSRGLPPDVIGVVAGGTLPIKFRMELVRAGAVHRIEIHPETFLLPASGSTLPLTARAYDVNGQQVDPGPITWQSSRSSVIGVASNGIATANSAAGSAKIVARAGGVSSAPALGLVAATAPGAMLIRDANVVTQSPALGASTRIASRAVVPVDSTAAYKPGWLYKVMLTGVAPAVGQILISQEEAAIGGRVVAVTPAGDAIEVTLALVAIAEMLPGLSIDESFALEEVPIEIPAAVLAGYSVTREDGGELSFKSRAPRSFGFASELGDMTRRASVLDSESEIDIGPFECKITTSGTPVTPSVTNSSFHIDPDLTLDLNYSPVTGLRRLVVRGSIDAGVTVTPVFPLEVEEKIACEVQLATIHLPVGGPLALFVGGEIPVGVGFEAGGKMTVANLGVEATVTAGVAMSLGIDCPTACGTVATIDGSATGSLKPLIPDFSTDLRLELDASGYAWAKLEIGNPFIESLRFEAFEAKAGLKQAALLATPKAQAADPLYASELKLSFDVEAGTGESLNELGELLGVDLSEARLALSTPLSRSPRSLSFAISPAQVRAMTATDSGEAATFTLALNPVNYLGSYAVDSIELFRTKLAGPGTFTMEKVPGSCGLIAPSSGQTTVSCSAVFPESWAGVQTIYAFVKPRIFGVSLPVLLELAEDAKAQVTIVVPADSPVVVVVTPDTVKLEPGMTQQYSALVTGIPNQAVTWSATGGTISATGLYRADTVVGSYTITATSVADPQKTGSVSVQIRRVPPIFFESIYATAQVRGQAGLAFFAGGYDITAGGVDDDSTSLTDSYSYDVGGSVITDGERTAQGRGAASVVTSMTVDSAGRLSGGTASGELTAASLYSGPEEGDGGSGFGAGTSQLRLRFQTSGLVTLRLRFSSTHSDSVSCNAVVSLRSGNIEKIFRVEPNLVINSDILLGVGKQVLEVATSCGANNFLAAPESQIGQQTNTGSFDLTFSLEDAG